MKVLLVEPWLGGSHRSWAVGYAGASELDVSVIGLEGRAWRWRLRGSSLPLARMVCRWVEENGAPDVLVVSGLTDVAQLLGLVGRSALGAAPVVVYQHESQLLYPTPSGQPDTAAVLHNWLSWAAADLVLFNSAFHRDAVIDALPKFLASLPDGSHSGFVDEIVDRFEVMSVGVDLVGLVDPQADTQHLSPGLAHPDGPIIVWPHRWEADKTPDVFYRALVKLDNADIPFRLVLAGEDPVSGSEQASRSRASIMTRFADRVVATGPFDRSEYVKWLEASDIVVSTAKHDFFGVGVVEAIAAGCYPVLPDDLAYPDLIPTELRATFLYRRGTFGSALASALGSYSGKHRELHHLRQSMARFDWVEQAPQYDRRLRALVSLSPT